MSVGIYRGTDTVRWYRRTGRLPALQLSTGQHLHTEEDAARLAAWLLERATVKSA